jgi:alpha-tubulin suppressor-like RCC1 family protein
VKCWGKNQKGQLGNNSQINALTAIDVGVTNAGDLATGSEHTCVLLNTGSISCWGSNSWGQLGYTTQSAYNLTPNLTNNIVNATAVVAGLLHTCALLSDKTMKCWGDDSNAQLGRGTYTGGGSYASAVVSLSNVKAMAAGAYHTCALLNTGSISCWGAKNYGQSGIWFLSLSGNPLNTARTVYALNSYSLPFTTEATAIAAGANHTCAVLDTLSARSITCWGRNDYGQLADGSFSDRNYPSNWSTIP